MTTWFKTTGYNAPKIEPVEVDSATEKFVVPKGSTRRVAKISSWKCFFPTWEEAHAYLLRGASQAAETARRTLERENGYLGNIKGMKKPAASA